MNALERDWAGLLPELVHIIATKVIDVLDFIRFRAVCKTWRSIATIADLTPQFPWLLCLCRGPDLKFYSIAFDKSFTIHAPKFTNKTFYHPCCGSMLVRSERYYSALINPLNNSEVSLPILRHHVNDWIGSRSFQSGDYVVFKGSGNLLHVYKPGDDETWINMEGEYDSTYFYMKNLIFIVHNFVTKVINLSTRETVFIVPPPWSTSRWSTRDIEFKLTRRPFLVESSGEVLIVTYGDKKFEIHRLEVGNGEGNPHWVKVTNIGDRILFLDFHNNYGDFSLSATDLCGFNFKGNCIYAIRGRERLPTDFNFSYTYTVERYDIESATLEEIYVHEEFITWYLPALNHI